jgi:hypothetical protein
MYVLHTVPMPAAKEQPQGLLACEHYSTSGDKTWCISVLNVQASWPYPPESQAHQDCDLQCDQVDGGPWITVSTPSSMAH